MTSIPKMKIDRYISKLVKSTRIDSRVGRLATEVAHKSYSHHLADCKSPNGLAAAYLYFAAILLASTYLCQVLLALPNLRSAVNAKAC